ncbi:MAG: zinc-binding dehydrogenase [Candidatus Thorarchaeota archaeon]
MRGAFYEGVRKIVIRDDFPKPTIQPDEVLIKVKYCGICGSGIESYKMAGMYSSGIILGHEFSGEIVEVGDKVKKLKIGNRVTANPTLPCSDCYWCNRNQENMCKIHNNALGIFTNGAMAEYINVNADRIHILSDSISYEEGATIEPLCVGLYAVQESGIKMGESAAVYGAGTIGLMTINALKAVGADIYVLELLESKHKLALELGADNVFSPKNWKKIHRLTNRRGPDHVFDCVGIGETITSSIDLVRYGGHITIVGMNPEPFEIKNFYGMAAGNKSLRGIYGYINDTFGTAINLLEKGKVNVKPMISKIIKLDEVPEIFEILSKPHDEIKVLVEID